MDTPHETEPEHALTDWEMLRLERMREYLRWRGEIVAPDHTVPAQVTIFRDEPGD